MSGRTAGRTKERDLLFDLMLLFFVVGCWTHPSNCEAQTSKPARQGAIKGGLFGGELGLPARGASMRVTRRPTIAPGQTFVLFDESGPGCLLHWWLTCPPKGKSETRDPVHDLQVRIYYDGQAAPAVDLPLAKFFGILFDHDLYFIEGAGIKVLPKNSFNCYLPMPFQTLRVELENRGKRNATIWFMGDWQRYAGGTELTRLRLRAVHAAAHPAEPAGSFLMADLTGAGFVAGMFKGVVVKDRSDAWYHSGGDLWLLDGEGEPRALRGVGGEDVFNMSFGLWATQNPWVGAPYLRKRAADTALGSGDEGVAYRFFGPDPVWFDHSAVVRFGSKANDLESVVYCYLDAKPAPRITTVEDWKLAGPFACQTYEDFLKPEWPEEAPARWPKTHVADFGQYRTETGPATFAMPAAAATEHGWCDFARHFRGRQRTNGGTQPCEVAAYAVGTIDVPEAGEYVLDVAYDDWMRLWINGREAHLGRHDQGFGEQRIKCRPPKGKSEIRIKLANFDNAQWRLWAFCLKVRN